MEIKVLNPSLKILERNTFIIATVIVSIWLILGGLQDAAGAFTGAFSCLVTIKFYKKIVQMMFMGGKRSVSLYAIVSLKLLLLLALALAIIWGTEERPIIAFLSAYVSFIPASLVMRGNPLLENDKPLSGE